MTLPRGKSPSVSATTDKHNVIPMVYRFPHPDYLCTSVHRKQRPDAFRFYSVAIIIIISLSFIYNAVVTNPNPVTHALSYQPVSSHISDTSASWSHHSDLEEAASSKHSATDDHTTDQPLPPMPVAVEPKLPPPLQPLLQHVKRPKNESPTRDWKRPAILTAQAQRDGDEVLLTVLMTAIKNRNFNRDFTVAGCLVGQKGYSALYALEEVVRCRMPASDPAPGDHITVLLVLDKKLEEAMAKTQILYGLPFQTRKEDLTPLESGVKLPTDVIQKAGGMKLMTVVSWVSWGEHIVDDAVGDGMRRHELCMMTQMKQYPYMLPQWFNYYRTMGVDQFYVYDNRAVTDLSAFSSKHVQVVYWPFERAQVQAVTHFLVAARRRCKYVAFFDADEYVFVGSMGPSALKQYVRHRVGQGFHQIRFQFLPMMNSGYVRRREGDLPELYTRRRDQQVLEKGKVVLSSDILWLKHRVHLVQMEDEKVNRFYQNETFLEAPKTLDDNAIIVHYSLRSWEEYVMKQRQGSASHVTSRRRKMDLKLGEPASWYLSLENTREYFAFRDYWRGVIKGRRENGTLVWDEGDRSCMQDFCAECEADRFGVPLCSNRAVSR